MEGLLFPCTGAPTTSRRAASHMAAAGATHACHKATGRRSSTGMARHGRRGAQARRERPHLLPLLANRPCTRCVAASPCGSQPTSARPHPPRICRGARSHSGLLPSSARRPPPATHACPLPRPPHAGPPVPAAHARPPATAVSHPSGQAAVSRWAAPSRARAGERHVQRAYADDDGAAHGGREGGGEM